MTSKISARRRWLSVGAAAAALSGGVVVLAPAAAADSSPSVVLASTSGDGVKSNDHSETPIVSADGRTVAFQTWSTNLDPADVDAVPDVYVKNLRSGDLVLASASDTGVKGNGWSSVGALSADGSKVLLWSSADNLDPADTDTEDDVYLKDLATGDILLVSTNEAGDKGNGSSRAEDISPDGSQVVFTLTSHESGPGRRRRLR